MIESKYFEGGDMKLPIPVTTISPTTGKTTGTKPLSDFTQILFDVYIDNTKVKEFSYPGVIDGRAEAELGDETHICVLPMLAVDHADKFGEIKIIVLASISDGAYASDYIMPAQVKGGRKCRI